MDVVDAHVHQWDPLNTPRAVSGLARLAGRMPAVRRPLTRLVPRRNREFLGDLTPHLRAYLPEDYTAAARPVTVRAVVHIEAGWKQTPTDPANAQETHWVGALPFGRNHSPELGAIVVAADPGRPDAGEILDAHRAASPLVRGVRWPAAHHPDPGIMDFVAAPGALAGREFLNGFAAVAERRLSFELWIYSHQIPDAVRLAEEYPETNFVLEHYAMPAGVLGPRGRSTGRTDADRADIFARWKDGISTLAALPNIVAKHTGLGMPILGAGSSAYAARRDRLAPLIEHVQLAFGADRAMWGSNQPIDGVELSLPDSIRMVREFIGDRDSTAVFAGTARRVYRI